ncbi:MAG: penicillin acylase family protein [Deltaproteobacteria bacterium]|nr:penicillin acylase family protein [Deltaproteobacteria bacterium]MBI3388238.1 penicillin acylase family protein [Deltaproteobacteria bacterium]
MSIDVSDLEALRAEARRVLPQVNGELHLAGLEQPVSVIRDHWGVAHLYAKTTRDLFFAQGFVHAQDRLWQMELRRRISSGRLAEVFGPSALRRDVFARTLGFQRGLDREWTTYDDETRAIITAYAAGVNAWIETHRGRLPLEFQLVGFEPEPWQPLDVLTRAVAYNQGGIWPRKVLRARLIARLGAERTRQLMPTDPDIAIEVPPGLDYGWIGADAVADHLESLGYPPDDELAQRGLDLAPGARWFGTQGEAAGDSAVGSNNWTVDGFKSTTGKPLLASDPHLGLAHPSHWYEMHLVGPTYDGRRFYNVTGCSTPGQPGIVIGRNARIAWGLTNASADVQDLYVEEFDPGEWARYRTATGWAQATVIEETLRVRGEADPHRHPVRVTKHGPIVYTSMDGRYGLALRWSAYEPGSVFNQMLAINRAANWEEFSAALRGWAAPPMNFLYADVDGHIGHVAAGAYPIRRHGAGLVPVPGWSDDYEWDGYAPFEHCPQTLDSPEHFLATANQRTTSKSSPHPVSHDWDAGFRAARIKSELHTRRRWAVADVAALQSDVTSLPAQMMVPYLVAALDGETNRDSTLAQDLLRGWNGVLSIDSAAAALYEVILHRWFANAFRAQLGDLFPHYIDQSSHVLQAALRLLEQPDPFWLAAAAGAEQGDATTLRDLVLRRCVREAVAELRERLGDDPQAWRWGRLHSVLFIHGAARTPELKRLFNVGPFEMPGDGFTPNNTGQNFRFSYRQVAAASYRQVVDLGNPDASLSIHTIGQSGQPESPHFGDFAPLWARGEYHPMLFTRAAIDAVAEATLMLQPRS